MKSLVRGGVLEDTFWIPLPRPQVLKNWPVLDSRTALFFESLKFCGAPEKFFGKRFFLEIAWKKILRPFLSRALALVSLASRISVLGLKRVCPWKGCTWPWRRVLCPRLHLCHFLKEELFFTTRSVANYTSSSCPCAADFKTADWRLHAFALTIKKNFAYV